MKRYVPLVRRTPPKRSARPVKGCTLFFKAAISYSTWTCEECGCYIPHGEYWQQLAAQAHILPQNIFPSVKNELRNRLQLCLIHHNDWDSSWEKASKMKVFPVALTRFNEFKHLIKEASKIPDIFKQACSLCGGWGSSPKDATYSQYVKCEQCNGSGKSINL